MILLDRIRVIPHTYNVVMWLRCIYFGGSLIYYIVNVLYCKSFVKCFWNYIFVLYVFVENVLWNRGNLYARWCIMCACLCERVRDSFEMSLSLSCNVNLRTMLQKIKKSKQVWCLFLRFIVHTVLTWWLVCNVLQLQGETFSLMNCCL